MDCFVNGVEMIPSVDGLIIKKFTKSLYSSFDKVHFDWSVCKFLVSLFLLGGTKAA